MASSISIRKLTLQYSLNLMHNPGRSRLPVQRIGLVKAKNYMLGNVDTGQNFLQCVNLVFLKSANGFFLLHLEICDKKKKNVS